MKKCGASCEFLIPLDADEFMVVVRSNSNTSDFSTSPDDVRMTISNLRADGYKYKFNGTFEGRAAQASSVSLRPFAASHFKKTRVDCMSKTFFLARTFSGTDQGNHKGRVKKPCSRRSPTWQPKCRDCFHVTNLALAHFSGSSTSFESYTAKMLRGAQAYGRIKKVDAGKPCSKGKGRHYCRFYQRLKLHGIKRLRENHQKGQARVSRGFSNGIIKAFVGLMLENTVSSTNVTGND